MAINEQDRQRIWNSCYDEASDMSTKDVAHLLFDSMSDEDILEYLKQLDEDAAEDVKEAQE